MTKKPGRRPQNALTGSELRSWIMSRVPQKGTSPEMVLRFGLHRLGFRFRVANRGLPGSPDIVLPKYRTAIFVHGCFWHRHKDCRFASTPSSNAAFWQKKFESNVQRDERAKKALRKLEWKVRVVWSCQLQERKLQSLVKRIKDEG